jgi:hypothetical protein
MKFEEKCRVMCVHPPPSSPSRFSSALNMGRRYRIKPEEAAKKYEKRKSQQPVSGSRFEPGTSRMGMRIEASLHQVSVYSDLEPLNITFLRTTKSIFLALVKTKKHVYNSTKMTFWITDVAVVHNTAFRLPVTSADETLAASS